MSGVGVRAEVEQAEVAQHRDEPVEASGDGRAGQAPPAALLHGAARRAGPGGRWRGAASPGRASATRTSVGRLRTRPEGALVGVLDHEHDRALEVRVPEQRLGHEQAARRPDHRAILAPCSRTGSTTSSSSMRTTTPTVAVRLDVTILAGAHKGEVVSVHATGLGADAARLPGDAGDVDRR